MTERSPYTLNPVQLEKAVQALQKAAETLRPKPNEERLYRRLGICVRVAIAVFAGAVLASVAFFMVVARAGATETALLYVFLRLMGGLAVLFVLAAVCATVLLLLNHSVIRQAFRQRLKESALNEAHYAMTLVPSSKDRLSGPGFEENLALVEMIIGENDRAISILTQLLQTPYGGWLYSPAPVTPALLRLDPIWDPLRADPAFQKLCEEK